MADLRKLLLNRSSPLVAVSPIVGGKALKGPAAKMMADLGMTVSASGIAEYYGELLDGIIIDTGDEREAVAIRKLGTSVLSVPSVMQTLDERISLARHSIEFVDTLARSGSK